ncbi:ABC transporter substrate-binding protein [Thermodesulfobacteriota bacterium]
MRRIKIGRIGVFFIGLLFITGLAWGEVGVTDTTVKIGSINDTTGPIAAIGIPRVETIQALVKYYNDKGGIHGRKIIYMNESDNYSPPRTVLAFKKLVDIDKIFCFIASMAVATTLAIAPEIQKRKIPYLMLGGQSTKLMRPVRRYFFVSYPTFEDYTRILVDFAANDLKMQNARIAHIFQEDEVGSDCNKGVIMQVKKYPGMKLAAELPFKRGTVDVSSQVQKAKAVNADVVMVSSIVTGAAMIVKEIKKIGWNPTILLQAHSGTETLIKLGGSAVEGVYAEMVMPIISEDVPGVRLFKQVIKKYYPESKVNPSQYGYSGLVDMHLGLEALERTGRNLTREKVIETLEYKFKNVDLGSLPPVSFSPENHQGSNSVNIVRVQNGKFVKKAAWRSPR